MGATAWAPWVRFLPLATPPTGVIAHSDEIAIGALRTIRRAGLRVPDDISVLGIDDHPLAEAFDLTTVHQDVRRQGELAARLLVDALAASQDQLDHPATRLVVRGSTGRPPRASAVSKQAPRRRCRWLRRRASAVSKPRHPAHAAAG